MREQERVTGLRRDGRWLEGTPAHEQPGFAADPNGRAVPPDSDVRLAAPIGATRRLRCAAATTTTGATATAG
ncbi:hypothetical protein [Streptomyces sp. I8-5]|uniref:hypothetical protein n=1 Tax=Streptomyces sp. I8-5 TaxID=3104277 RepID=UPI00386CB405